MRSSLDGDDFNKPCTLRASTDCIQELCQNIISAIKRGAGRARLHCFLARLRAAAPAGGIGRHRDVARRARGRRHRRRTRRRRAARAADRPRPQVQATSTGRRRVKRALAASRPSPPKYPTTCLTIPAARTGAPLPPWRTRSRLTASSTRKATPWVPCIASRSVCPQSRIFSERCSGTNLAAGTAVYQRFQLPQVGRTQVFTGEQGLRLRKDALPRHARQERRHGTRDETGHKHRQPVRHSMPCRHPCWPARRAATGQTEQQTRQHQRRCALQRRRHCHLHGIPPAVSPAASLAINASAARQASPSGCRARMRAAAAWASA